MADATKPGKTMSSRLLTMKFMQRAAASDLSAPSTPPEPPSKKQRLSNGSNSSTPSSTPRSDAQVVREALAAEEQKRIDALDREAADRGETKWYLSFQESPSNATHSPLRVVSAGYGTLDASGHDRDHTVEEDTEDTLIPQMKGRRSFGKFNRAVEKQQNPDLDSDSNSSSESSDSMDDEDEDESDDPSGAKAMIAQSRREAGEKARAQRKAKKKADKAEAVRMADERRNKQVKLNQLSSISGAGSSPNRPPSGKDKTDGRCFTCGEPGHQKRDCPKRNRHR